MTKREIFLATLNHEKTSIPAWTMGFFNIATAKRLLGEENVPAEYLPTETYKFGASSMDDMIRNIKYTQAIDNYAIGVGKGASFSWGHCGPGEFLDKIISRSENQYISIYETGTKKKTQLVPHFYHNYDHPLESLAEVSELVFPDPNEKSRYAGIKEEADFYKKEGFYTFANLNGIFSGVHYFCYPYDKLFIDMLEDQDGLLKLVKKLSDFNLTAAENLLRCGVDCINFCDDLGNGTSLLFSPELLDVFFIPYYTDLAQLCHSYGAKLHMHSHGNIVLIIDKLCATGIDIMNPFDPYEVGPMSEIKEKFGKKVIVTGGLNKFFFDWTKDRMYAELQQVILAGKKGGGFILMDSGGIPENISQEMYDYFREISRELRML